MFRPIRRGQLAFDIAAPSGLFLLLLVPYSGTAGTLPLLLGMCAALVFWRLNAGIALGIAWLTALWQMLAGLPPDPSNLAIFIVLYATSAYGTRVVKWAGFASAFLGAAAIVAYMVVQPAVTAGSVSSYLTVPDFIRSISMAFFPFLALFLLAWTLGLLSKSYSTARESRRAQTQAEVEQERAELDVMVEQERTRIARDMHDVVAHSLAVVIAQADGARYARAADPTAVDDALTTISTTAREALGDVRILLAQLRHSQAEGPQPVLEDLDRLFEQLRSAGLSIVHRVTGEAGPLGTGQQLAIYRIVQEALTNALRHGDSSEEVVVDVDWTADAVDVTITSALDGEPPVPLRPGHGLAGMRERAILVGGHLTAEPGAGIFVVHACIPRSPGPTGALTTIPLESIR